MCVRTKMSLLSAQRQRGNVSGGTRASKCTMKRSESATSRWGEKEMRDGKPSSHEHRHRKHLSTQVAVKKTLTCQEVRSLEYVRSRKMQFRYDDKAHKLLKEPEHAMMLF